MNNRHEFLEAIKKKINFEKLKYEINPRNHIARSCRRFLDQYNNYTWDMNKNGEFELLKRISNLEFKIFFDVGANVGEWTQAVIRQNPTAKIYCFEISEEIFNILKNNQTASNVKIHNLGLSNSTEEIEYKDYGKNLGINSIIKEVDIFDKSHKPKILTAKVTRGDAFCEENSINEIDFLKIDVEGAEHLVLDGFSKFLVDKKIRLIQFEYGYPNGDSKFLMKDFFNLFHNYGYRIGKLRQGGVQFIDWDYKYNDFRSGPNYVATKIDDEQLSSAIAFN